MALQFGMYKKISIVLPTDFYLSITVTDSFQNYCMTSQLCSLECTKRSALFSLQICTCPSFQNYCMTWHLCSLECTKRSALFSLQIFTYPSQWQTASKSTAWLDISAVWNVQKDQRCSPYRFVPVRHSDRRLPKLLHGFMALQFGMYEKINFFTSYRFPHVHHNDSK